MSGLSETRLLHQLARLYGVQTAYYDVFGHRREASVEALLAVLQSLGASVATARDIPSAWRERRQVTWQQRLEPVVVAWDGKPPPLKLRLPSHMSEVPLIGHLTQESGERGDGLYTETPPSTGKAPLGISSVHSGADWRGCGEPYHCSTL